jgi:hypothetical protein
MLSSTIGATHSALSEKVAALDAQGLSQLLIEGATITSHEKEEYLRQLHEVIHHLHTFVKDPNVFKKDDFYKSPVCTAYVKRERRNQLLGGTFLLLGVAQLLLTLRHLYLLSQAVNATWIIGNDVKDKASITPIAFKPSFTSLSISSLSGLALCTLGVKKIKEALPSHLWNKLYQDVGALIKMIEQLSTVESN